MLFKCFYYCSYWNWNFVTDCSHIEFWLVYYVTDFFPHQIWLLLTIMHIYKLYINYIRLLTVM